MTIGAKSTDRAFDLTGRAALVSAPAAASVDRTVERFGRSDLQRRGQPEYGPLMQADPGAVHKIFDVNVVAALGFVQQAHRVWMGEHGARWSVSGLRSTAAIAAYGMFKAALIRLTEELAWEFDPSIRVNAVVPAVVKTRAASWITGETVRVDGGLLATGTPR